MQANPFLQIPGCLILLLHLLLLRKQVQQPNQILPFIMISIVLRHLYGRNQLLQMGFFLQQKRLLLRKLQPHFSALNNALYPPKRKPQILQQQNALQHHQRFPVIAAVSCLRIGNRLQQTFGIIIANGAQGDPCHSGDFPRRVQHILRHMLPSFPVSPENICRIP